MLKTIGSELIEVYKISSHLNYYNSTFDDYLKSYVKIGIIHHTLHFELVDICDIIELSTKGGVYGG